MRLVVVIKVVRCEGEVLLDGISDVLLVIGVQVMWQVGVLAGVGILASRALVATAFCPEDANQPLIAHCLS